MQDVNNDMDELFRRAANSYPLNTESANWNKVLDALHAQENVEAEDVFTRQNNIPNVLLLLLLLSLPLFLVDYSLINNRMASEKTTKNHLKMFPDNINTLSKATSQRSLAFIRRNTRREEYYTNKKRYSPDFAEASTNETNVLNQYNRTRNKGIFANPSKGLNRVDDSSITKSKEESSKSNEINFKGVSPISKNDFKNIDTVSSKTEAKKQTGFGQNKNKRLYAALLAGPDLSTIKFQTVNKTGFSAGLLIGYTLSKKIAIETGLLWDKKLYYTEGKYFNPKNFSIPSSVTIDDVNGSCSMIEWSTDLSYKIKSFKKSSLTANAGVSSYFMKNENYSYTFQRYNVESEWSVGYKNSSVNLFSVVNLAVSYNHNISKLFGVRMQPYVKVPVRDIGMGRLPITSAGVYVILTKKIL